MCGINIIVSTSDRLLKAPLMAMQEVNRFRGPDASQVFEDKQSNWQIGIGVNRLQVIDFFEQIYNCTIAFFSCHLH